jgi:death on curing protein
MAISYITIEQLIFLHEKITEASSGSPGLRDFGLLHAAIERPKASFAGKDLYLSIFEKAAALVNSLILNRAFVDANKRTAIASMIGFLEINNYIIKASFDELIDLSLKIENKKIDIGKTTDWLKKHMKK